MCIPAENKRLSFSTLSVLVVCPEPVWANIWEFNESILRKRHRKNRRSLSTFFTAPAWRNDPNSARRGVLLQFMLPLCIRPPCQMITSPFFHVVQASRSKRTLCLTDPRVKPRPRQCARKVAHTTPLGGRTRRCSARLHLQRADRTTMRCGAACRDRNKT